MNFTNLDDFLKNEGISANAAKVYRAALRCGSGSLSDLASVARLHPQSVKNAVPELERQGLLSRLDYKTSRMLFRPAPPYLLARRLRRKQEQLERLLPLLQKQYREKAARFIRTMGGDEAFQRLYRELLEQEGEGNTILILSHPGRRLLRLLDEGYAKTEAIRLERGIHKRILLNPKTARRLKQHPEMLAELQAEYRVHKTTGSSFTQICGAEQLLQIFDDPAEPTSVLVRGRGPAQEVAKLFSILWAQAKPLTRPSSM